MLTEDDIMAIATGQLYIIGNATSDSTGNAISSTDWAATSGVRHRRDEPEIGDVVRATERNYRIRTCWRDQQIFKFKFIHDTGNVEKEVTVANIPAGSEQSPTKVLLPLFCSLFATFTAILQVTPLK